MYSFLFRFGRHRRRKKDLPDLSRQLTRANASVVFRFCTGILLLSSVLAFHVTFVRYVEDHFQHSPEVERKGFAEYLTDKSGSKFPNDREDTDQSTEGEDKGLGEEGNRGGVGGGGGGRKLLSDGTRRFDGDSNFDPNRSKGPLEYSRTYLGQQVSQPCRNGHIQGLKAICDPLPCLRSLLVSGPSLSVPRRDPISPERLRQLNRIPGYIGALHYTLVPFVTDMQWSLGIFGSVGEIGVSLGKFTTLLSMNLDMEAGERLFVSDPFNSSTVSIAGLSQYEIFSAHVKDFGFQEERGYKTEREESSYSTDRRLFVHRGSPSEAIKRLLLEWNLPRFRLISLESDRSDQVLLVELELASCLIRDGGIVVIDGNDQSEGSLEVVFSTLTAFFARNGHAALVPLFVVSEKVYLTTSNWKRTYLDYFEANTGALEHLHIEAASTAFGKGTILIR